MAKEITEKSIRAALHSGQQIFRKPSIEALLSIIDEQRGTIAMHEANADEASLKAARREAALQQAFPGYAGTICNLLLLDGSGIRLVDCKDCGDSEMRLRIELRNLRAQVLEARAWGVPHSLFENLSRNMAGEAIVAQESERAVKE